jgi:hypothetical protein
MANTSAEKKFKYEVNRILRNAERNTDGINGTGGETNNSFSKSIINTSSNDGGSKPETFHFDCVGDANEKKEILKDGLHRMDLTMFILVVEERVL